MPYKDKTEKTSIFFVFTGIIISTCRIGLNLINADDNVILLIMSTINYISIGIVILFLFKDLNNNCIEKINISAIGTPQKKSMKKIIHMFYFIFCIFYLILGILYMIFIKDNTSNDVLSIMALTISIKSTELSYYLTHPFFRFIKSCAKIIKN